VSPGNLTAKEWLWLFSLTQEEPSCSKCLDYIRKKLKEMVALKKPDTTWFILWKGLCMLEFLCVSGPTPVLSYLIAHHHLHSDAYLFHLENNFHTLHPTPPGAPAPGVDMGQLVRSKAKKIIETVCDSDRHATLRQESMGFVQLPGFLVSRSEVLNSDHLQNSHNLTQHLANPTGLSSLQLRTIPGAGSAGSGSFQEAVEAFRVRSVMGYEASAAGSPLRQPFEGLGGSASPPESPSVVIQGGFGVEEGEEEQRGESSGRGEKEGGDVVALVEACTSLASGDGDLRPVDVARICHLLKENPSEAKAVVGVLVQRVAMASCDDANPHQRWLPLWRSLALLETLLDKGVAKEGSTLRWLSPTLMQLQRYGLSLVEEEDRHTTARVRTQATVLLNMLQANEIAPNSHTPSEANSSYRSHSAEESETVEFSKKSVAREVERIELGRDDSLAKPPISSNPLFDNDEDE